MGIKFEKNAMAGSVMPAPVTVSDSTVSLWLKIDSLPSSTPTEREVRRIFRCYMLDDDGYPLELALVSAQDAYYNRFDGAPVLDFYRGYTYTAWKMETGEPAACDFADGALHHFAFVSRASDGSLLWYLDGVPQRAADFELVDSDAWTGDWRRGSRFDYVGVGAQAPDQLQLEGVTLLSGGVDGLAELAIYNAALTDSQVAKLASGAPASIVRQGALVSYQRFFEGARNFIAGADDETNAGFGLAGSVATVVSSPSSTHSVSLPAEAAADKFCVIIGTTFGATFSTPAGWTLRETNTADGETSVLSKMLTGSEGSSISISCAGSTRGIWHSYVFDGASAETLYQYDQMVTTAEIPMRGTEIGGNVIKLIYGRTRRTDNTLAVDTAYVAELESETSSNSTDTAEGRLVSGYRGPEWDGLIDAADIGYTGTTDGLRAGTMVVGAANHQSGISDGISIIDHPQAVLDYVVPETPRTLVVKANGRDTGEDQRADPNADLDYIFDWSDWLADDEFIETCVVTAGNGITAGRGQTDGDRVFVWLSGGSNGVTYPVVCRITTNQSRIDDRTMNVFVLER